MPEQDYRRALDLAASVAAEAAAILLAECALESGPRGSAGKCPADTEAEELIRERLLAEFPSWGFVGEETGPPRAPAPGESHIWLVDPNDGTSSMHQGYRGHAVSIGLLRDGQPVLGVVHAVNGNDDAGDRFDWAEGCGPLRRNGGPVEREPWPDRLRPQDVVIVSQAADLYPAGNLACTAPARFRPVASVASRLALAAAGDGEAIVSLNGPAAWDYGAGHALIRSVGGVLLDQHGREVAYRSDGQSWTSACFGGAPAVAAELAGRDWGAVRDSGFGEAEPPPEMRPARLRAGSLFHDTPVLRRAQGCLLGQLAGDALGSLVEFQRPEQIARAYPDGPRRLVDGGTWDTIAGQPTDDSELALMLARTLLARGTYDREAVAAAYARWFHGWVGDCQAPRASWQRPFDVGTTTARALGAIDGDDVRNGRAADAAEQAASRSSQANGALMRVSPLGIWGWSRDPTELAELARADARLTHPHPVCQDASAVFVVAIAHAIREGSAPLAVYRAALEWARADGVDPAVLRALEAAQESPPEDFVDQQGWVLLALQNAFHRLVAAPSIEAGVVETVRRGGDTDTNAAICGALLGAVQGRPAVPDQWQRMVLSCRPMPGHAHIRRPRPAQYWPADAMVLAERLLGGNSMGLFLELPPRPGPRA